MFACPVRGKSGKGGEAARPAIRMSHGRQARHPAMLNLAATDSRLREAATRKLVITLDAMVRNNPGFQSA